MDLEWSKNRQSTKDLMRLRRCRSAAPLNLRLKLRSALIQQQNSNFTVSARVQNRP